MLLGTAECRPLLIENGGDIWGEAFVQQWTSCGCTDDDDDVVYDFVCVDNHTYFDFTVY